MVGNATYYSNRLHGRKVSSGTRYHKDSLTCAHKTLPFGTLLKVRNQKTNAEVVVEVTDRGPHRRDAIIDLSYAAAKQIGILRDGIARVEVNYYDPEEDDDVSIPYRKNLLPRVPQLNWMAPHAGSTFFSMAEKSDEKQASRLKMTMKKSLAQRAAHLKGDSVPRWRVVPGKLTAHAESHSSKLPEESFKK